MSDVTPQSPPANAHVQPHALHETSSALPFKTDKLVPLLLRFLNRLKQTGKSVHTISAYRNDLSLFCQFLAGEKIDPRDFQSQFQERWTH